MPEPEQARIGRQIASVRTTLHRTEEGKRAFLDEHEAITRDWGRVREAGARITRSYVIGLGELYVADPRFGKNYDRYGDGTAAFVRDALTIHAEHRLSD